MLVAVVTIPLVLSSGGGSAEAATLVIKKPLSGIFLECQDMGLVLIETEPPTDPSTATYVVTGALPAGLTWNGTNQISGTIQPGAAKGGPASNGVYPLDITVTAGADSGQASITWTVGEPRPSVAFIGPKSSPANGQPVTPVTFTVTEPDGDLPLTINISGLPTGLDFSPKIATASPTSVTISGTTTCAQGDYPVIVTATDCTGLDFSQPFTWTVTDPVPVLNPIGPQSSAEGEPKTIDISATDDDDLTFSLEGNPAWITIASTGPKTARITAVTPKPGSGIYPFTVVVKDNLNQSDSETVTWTVRNRPPSWTAAISPRSVTEGGSVNLGVTASDPEGDPLSYGFVDLPPGLTLDTTGANPVIKGTVGGQAAQGQSAGQVPGTYASKITVNDPHNPAVELPITWTVIDGTVPSLPSLPNRTTPEGSPITAFTVSAVDTDGDTLTYSAGAPSTLPSGITLDPASGQISGTPGVHAQGSYTVRLTASDGRNTSAARTFTWTVTDATPPSITSSLGNQASNEGASVSLQVTATDADQDSLTFTASGLPAGLSINATTGLISGIVASSAAQTSNGSYHVTVTVTDGINPATRSFTWTVNDITTPAFTNSAANTSQQINEGATPADLAAYDSDSDRLTFSTTSGTLPEGLTLDSDGGWSGKASMKSAGTYTLTITVTDGVRSSTTTLSLKIVDTTKPSFTSASANRSQSVSTGQPLQPLKATDSDHDPLTFKLTSGSLPPGITLDGDDGTFIGVVGPTANGQYRATISVSDGTQSATTTLVVNVTQIRPPMTIVLVIGSSRPTVNGTPKTLDAVPFVTPNGRTMVPVRFITEVLGALVDWDNTTRKVTVRLDPTIVILTIGSTTAVVNAQNQTLDAPAQISHDRTFVPLRFISEAFGLTVDYNNATKTITITRK